MIGDGGIRLRLNIPGDAIESGSIRKQMTDSPSIQKL